MNSGSTRRKEAASLVAQSWNSAGLCYAVTHGVENYPEKVGRDLDVIIADKDIPKALSTAEEVLKALGYAVVHPPKLWGERLLAIDENDWTAALEIHSIRRIVWRNVVFRNYPQPSGSLGPFAIDPLASIAKRILVPLLVGASNRFVERHRELTLSTEESIAIRRILPSLSGQKACTQLLDALETKDLSALKKCAQPLGQNLILRALLSAPLESFLNVARIIVRRLLQPFCPCAPMVVLTGPETQTIEDVAKCLKDGSLSIFNKMIIRPESDGSGAAPLRLAHRFLRLIRDRIDSSRQCLVIYTTQTPSAFPEADLIVSLSAVEGMNLKKMRFLKDNGTPEEMAQQIRRLILQALIEKLQR